MMNHLIMMMMMMILWIYMYKMYPMYVFFLKKMYVLQKKIKFKILKKNECLGA